ncbi:MAG: hypothetical protein N3F05_00675 [Candidatus Diapherotrites archaeon]|nr:hypothetical protein [Candidatus Diapherotrites archaeon]
MKTFEVMIAGVIIIGMLAMLSIPTITPQAKYSEVRANCESALLSIAEDNSLRASIIAASDENSLLAIKEQMSRYIKYPFEVQICDENNQCIGQKPESGNYVLVAYLFDGNITHHKLVVMKLYARPYDSQ